MTFDFNCLLFCFVIMVAKISEISIQSVKMVFMVKGRRNIASVLAFCECIIWGLVVSSVITELSSNFAYLLSYCIGYALGLFCGSVVEEKIAFGNNSVQLIVKNDYEEQVEEFLRQHNFGYTVLDGHGARGESHLIIAVLPRKRTEKIISEIQNICDNKAFVVTSDIGKFSGGYGLKK